ncbi:HNH endonuclease [Salinisphaera orenii MK-B5]|uniref:HNH endonuclease n=1 Tax=Salinisphaera orenii MK-B5 TaxID=856730 RepID=A0A423PXZ0_9GAMM|nr:HNH endonuclease signature motif containing protein [Salinisphaera orenii]ROO30415.1 HNH endonuclease [Salinisphaera orenii MK-B5]
MGVRKYRPNRPSELAQRDRRWPGLRLAALRRDDWRCVQCASKRRLEVDHVESVRKRPDLAFDLTNLQTLCAVCHGKKTRFEMTGREPNPELDKWRELITNT